MWSVVAPYVGQVMKPEAAAAIMFLVRATRGAESPDAVAPESCCACGAVLGCEVKCSQSELPSVLSPDLRAFAGGERRATRLSALTAGPTAIAVALAI